MEDVRNHISKYYAYHGVEVVRSNTETCVCTLPPQFRDVGALTADLWLEFGATVDLRLSNRDMEITVRRGSPPDPPSQGCGLFTWIGVATLAVAGMALVFTQHVPIAVQ